MALLVERQCHPPALVTLPFLSGYGDPPTVWGQCKAVQANWGERLSGQYAKVMEEFKKKMVAETISVTNLLEDTLPKEIPVHKAEEAITKAYKDSSIIEEMLNEEKFSQLAQHLKAYIYLCESNSPPLTEELIKETHSIMMHGLKNEDGMSINAGSYRTIPVHAGTSHAYPSYECIPSSMAKIVAEYEERFARPHDPFELASWLHFSVVTLHPFEDGNGRTSRLLWCYSLMRDGLPFPVVLTSGHKKSQKHHVLCLKRDESRLLRKDNPHMTSLTVASVFQAWQKFSEFSRTPFQSFIE